MSDIKFQDPTDGILKYLIDEFNIKRCADCDYYMVPGGALADIAKLLKEVEERSSLRLTR